MTEFWKDRSSGVPAASREVILGRLERDVMEVLWERGPGSVREVRQRLSRDLAYTTVMTTLDRLFKKGLLERHRADRAFIYKPRSSRHEWEYAKAGSLLASFLDNTQVSREWLISRLVETAGERDLELLDELERKIRARREELVRRGDL